MGIFTWCAYNRFDRFEIGDDFFAGDTVFGIGSLIYPPFADHPEEFPAAWCTILDSGAKCIYPGNGKPFLAAELEKQYAKRFGHK